MDVGLFLYLFASFTLVNIIYYLFLSKTGFYKSSSQSIDYNTPVSVIVCSKNEEKNLSILIPLLLDQDHNKFEIILVNDASHDNTRDVIEEYMVKDERVKLVDVVNNESFWGNKKYALTLGIKKAAHERLVFIDADCIPNSKEWLSIISSQFSSTKSIVLGYGGYIKKKRSFLNALIRFETGFTAIQYMSYALLGNPYMGVGRNLAYTATQFYEVSGFMSHMKVLGGDDDLFVDSAADSKNTAICLSPEAFTYSAAKTTWKSWWTQKRRHINTAQHYKLKNRLLLGIFYLSQIGFFVSAVIAFSLDGNWMLALGILLLRYAVFYVVVGKGLVRFRESDIILYTPILELFLIVSQFLLFISNLINQPKQWN